MKYKHGHSGDYTTSGKKWNRTKTYNSWRKMMERCYNPRQDGYENFGGKNIIVDADWHDFREFLADMGEKPEGNYVLSRIDIRGNYEVDNCRWSDRKVHARNQAVKRATT